MKKTWISGEPSQEQQACQKYSKSTLTTGVTREPRMTSKEFQGSLQDQDFGENILWTEETNIGLDIKGWQN